MSGNKWLVLALAAVFALGAVPMADAGALSEIVKRGELRVACQTQGPPFSFVDKNGERTGSSIDVVKMMAEEMGVKLKLVNYDWDGLIPALLAKKADILAADMTPTLKRALKVSFTKPFYTTYSVFLKKAGNDKLNTLKDIDREGVSVGVLLGSSQETQLKETLKKAEIKSYKGGGSIVVNAVAKGQCDVGFNDYSAFSAQVSDYPKGTLEFLEGRYGASPLAFALRPEDTHLLEWCNLFFDWIEMDGRLKKNLDYWVNSQEWKKDH